MRKYEWASYLMYFLGGMTTVLLGSIMPQLITYYHTSYTTGGVLALLASLGFIAGVPITTFLMNRLSYRFLLALAAGTVAIAQIAVSLLLPLPLLGLLIILNGLGAASLETAVASYNMEIFKGRRAIMMSRLEVAFGLGALILPSFASLFIKLGLWSMTPLLIAMIALFLMFFWPTIKISTEHQSTSDAVHVDAITADPPKFITNRSRYLVLLFFLVSILLYVGVEGSLNTFLPTLFEVGMKTKPYLATISTTIFWGSIVIGRLLISRIVQKIRYEQYILISMLLGAVFFLFIIIAPTLLLAFLAIFGLGISLSAIYSIIMVFANHTFPGKERLVTSSITAFAGIGSAVFPAIIGYAIDHLTTHQVFGLILLFILCMIIVFITILVTLSLLRKNTRLP
nr:MFS transporter [Bacilli bacterium]